MISRKGQSSCSCSCFARGSFVGNSIIWKLLQPLTKWQILGFSQDFPLPCSHQLFTDSKFFSVFWLLQFCIKLLLCHRLVPVLCWFCLLVKKTIDGWALISNGKIRLICIYYRKLQVLSFRKSFWFLFCFSLFRQKRWKTKTFEVEVTLEEEEDTFLIQTQVTEQFLVNTSHSWNNSCKNHSWKGDLGLI